MKHYVWDENKNLKLQKDRGVSFEEVVFQIQNGFLLDQVTHPNKEKYGGQNIFIVEIDHYSYLVPYIETEHDITLKTIIPSRKATKKYLKGAKNG